MEVKAVTFYLKFQPLFKHRTFKIQCGSGSLVPQRGNLIRKKENKTQCTSAINCAKTLVSFFIRLTGMLYCIFTYKEHFTNVLSFFFRRILTVNVNRIQAHKPSVCSLTGGNKEQNKVSKLFTAPLAPAR